MSERRVKISIESCRQHMLVYAPDSLESPDNWAGNECSSTKVGDAYLLFAADEADLLEKDPFELELESIALVIRQDGGFPVNYLLAEKNYEMSFLEGVLSGRATAAAEKGLCFYCLKAGFQKPPDQELLANLAGMSRAYGSSGKRSSNSIQDPICYFLKSLGVRFDTSLQQESPSLTDFALALFNPSALPPGTSLPEVGQYFDTITGSASLWVEPHVIEAINSVFDGLKVTEIQPGLPGQTNGHDTQCEITPAPTENVPAENVAPQSTPAQDVPHHNIAAENANRQASETVDSESQTAAGEELTSFAPDNDRQPPRHPVSLQETLARLEEQKNKAQARIEEFQAAHETACARGLETIKPQIAAFEKSFNDYLVELKDSVVKNMRIFSRQAIHNLSATVAGASWHLESSLEPALLQLLQFKNELGIEKALTELEADFQQFVFHYSSRLGELDERNLVSALSEQTETQLSNLEPVFARKLEEQERVYKLALSQMRQHFSAARAALDTVVNSMAEKLLRIKTLDQEKLASFQRQLHDDLDQTERKIETEMSRICQQELVARLLPVLSQLKNSIYKTSFDLTSDFNNQLQDQLQELIAQFNQLLARNQDLTGELGRTVDEQQISFEKDGKEQIDLALSTLSAHLDQRLSEFKELSRRLIEADKSDSQEKRLLRQVNEVRSNSLSAIEALAQVQQADGRRQMEAVLQSWLSQSETAAQAAELTLSLEVEKFTRGRQEAKQKLQDKLEQLTAKARTISTEILQP